MTITVGPPPSITSRVTAAMGWLSAAVALRLGLRLGVMMILARLLPVSAFGLLSLAAVVQDLAGRFKEAGMVPALIQRREIRPGHVRAAFTLSVLSGSLLTVTIWFTAPALATLVRAPALVPVIRLMSCALVFDSFGTTAGALLQRRLRFKVISTAQSVAYFVGFGLVGVISALRGAGALALAWASVVQSFTMSLLLYAAVRHTIKPRVFTREAAQLLRFSSGETLSRIATYVAAYADSFLVGRTLGVVALGFYSRAYTLMLNPLAEYASITNAVLFPAFAAMQDEPDRARRGYLASVYFSMIVLGPLLAMLAMSSEELITVMFGVKWHGSVVPFRLLCMGGIFRSYGMGDSVARANGAVYGLSWRYSIFAGLIVCSALTASRWGISGVALSVAGASVVIYFLIAQLALSVLSLRWKQFFFALLPGSLMTLICAAATGLTSGYMRSLHCPRVIILGAANAIAALLGIGTLCLLPERLHNVEVTSIVRVNFDRLRLSWKAMVLPRGLVRH